MPACIHNCRRGCITPITKHLPMSQLHASTGLDGPFCPTRENLVLPNCVTLARFRACYAGWAAVRYSGFPGSTRQSLTLQADICDSCEPEVAMPWIRLPGIEGLVYEPELPPRCERKHNCTDCYSCHDDDYNSTNDPNHVAAGFPTDCESCHNTVNWDDADFNHDGEWFPIYSGSHRNEWSSCSECHTNSSNYSVFSCITCHEHNQSEMNSEHDEVPNYQYNSEACYSCHPRGEEGGDSFPVERLPHNRTTDK